ncbi:hypothetical protein JC221_033 [Yersinia phage JC221]|nr:hypothetical protein JC221_033 [Yersinia phage JC221]
MSYVVYFDSYTVDRDVFDNARDNNQIVTHASIDDDGLAFEFESSREFEKDNFLNYLKAKKSVCFRDYYIAYGHE